MSKRVLNKVQGAFQDLGIELKKGHSLYEFEYEHVFMFLSMDAKDQSIAFVTYVVDSGDISMDEQILNTALDIVDGFHEDCCGDWNDGVPYFVSPCYELKGTKEVTAGWLEEQLMAFYDAYMFLEANIHLLCDTSIFGIAKEGVVQSSMMTNEEVEVMIAKDFIKNVSLLGVDAGDIKAIKENSDFLDGCKKYCYAKEMKVCLQTAIDNMSKAHADAKLTHLGVKLLLNKESELMLDETSTLGDVFNNLEGVEVVWGIGKNDSPQNGKIAICVVGGFMNN